MIFINWITELINELPSILGNIMYGYIFLFAYRWVTFKDKSDMKYTLVVSIILNYILVLVYDYLHGVKYINQIVTGSIANYVILSFVLAIIIGLIIRSDSYNEILRDIHIARNTNDNIWDDIVKNGTWLRIYTKDPDINYFGAVVNCEPFKSNPKITLTKYQILNLNGEVLADYSKDEKEYVVLNTEGFDRIEITYSSNSVCRYVRFKRWFHTKFNNK